MPGGRLPHPRRTISQLLHSTPKGLPRTKATATPESTVKEAPGSKLMPSRLTPALAKANSGITRKATQGCSAICTRVTGGSNSRCACRSCLMGSINSVPLPLLARSRAAKSLIARDACCNGASMLVTGRTGVIRPSTTPAKVGWAPVFSRPNQSNAPGRR
ncbi:hypothetical protein D3C84_906330 [compost metagenome]